MISVGLRPFLLAHHKNRLYVMSVSHVKTIFSITPAGRLSLYIMVSAVRQAQKNRLRAYEKILP